jgi:hypothetical protein
MSTVIEVLVNKFLHPTHTAPRFLCISLRYILSTKIALQYARLSKALAFNL